MSSCTRLPSPGLPLSAYTALAYCWWGKVKKSDIIGKILFCIFVIVGLFFLGKNAYRDIVFIGKEKYLVIECNINSLAKHKRKTNEYYNIYGIERINGKTSIGIEMDFYQYNELMKEKNTNGSKILVVYYLPNTKRMLKYE